VFEPWTAGTLLLVHAADLTGPCGAGSPGYWVMDRVYCGVVTPKVRWCVAAPTACLLLVHTATCSRSVLLLHRLAFVWPYQFV